jgi:protein involved in polysaccharide export with SLBB domain
MMIPMPRPKERGMEARPSFLVHFCRLPRPGPFLPFFAVCLLLAGCATGRTHFDQALLDEGGTASRNAGVAEGYAVSCPDVLEVAVEGRPDLGGRRPVGPDGRIELGPNLAVRVEGRTPGEVARTVAKRAGVPAGRVRVRVAQYNSSQLYLSGQGTGVKRTVPYQGQETVLDLLQRVGGITPEAAPDDVYVVRPHVSDGERPEVFHVDLHAIVMNKDQRTNVRLQPFDQIYVGETKEGKVGKCLPPWLRPFYRACCGIGQRPPPVPPTPDSLPPGRVFALRKDREVRSADLVPPAER